MMWTSAMNSLFEDSERSIGSVFGGWTETMHRLVSSSAGAPKASCCGTDRIIVVRTGSTSPPLRSHAVSAAEDY